jgi:MFS family permease
VRRLLLLVGSIVFLDTMFFAALTPLLPEYADRFGLSKAGAGLLAAAYPLGVLVGGIPSGLAAVRFGLKPTVVGGLLLMAVTTFVFGFADSVWLLDAARFAQGIASACAWAAGLAWLVASAPGDRRGELIGTVIGVAIVGALFGPVLGGIASTVGTEAAFSAVGVAAIGLAGWAFVTHAPPTREGQSLRLLVRSFRNMRIRAGIWLVMLPALMFGTLSVLAPLRLSDLGFGAVAIGAVFLVSAGFEAALSPLVGRLTDRRGRRLPILVGLIVSAAANAVLPWPEVAIVLALVVVLSAMCFGTFWTPAMSLLTHTGEAIGLDHALTFALVNVAWAPGQALGAAAGGGLARVTSDAVPYLLLCATCVLTLVAMRLGERRVAGSPATLRL